MSANLDSLRELQAELGQSITPATQRSYVELGARLPSIISELEAAQRSFVLSVEDVEVLDKILGDWQDLSSSAIDQIPGAVDFVARLGAWLHEHESQRRP